MSSDSFLIISRDPQCIVSRHLQTVSFPPPFPILIPFISFHSVIAMAISSKTMLNNSGENGHPCLVPDLRGNAFTFS